jgi:hypothetical protein
VRIIQAFLAGTAPPYGVHVRVISDGPPAVLVATTATARMRITLARARHVPAGAFRRARGKPAQIVQELHPGAHPSQAVAAYWLGPDWNGHAARRSAPAIVRWLRPL